MCQGTREAHGDDLSREDALEEYDDPKMDAILQAAQVRADTKEGGGGWRAAASPHDARVGRWVLGLPSSFAIAPRN